MTRFEDLSDDEKWKVARDDFSKLEARIRSLATIVLNFGMKWKSLRKNLGTHESEGICIYVDTFTRFESL